MIEQELIEWWQDFYKTKELIEELYEEVYEIPVIILSDNEYGLMFSE